MDRNEFVGFIRSLSQGPPKDRMRELGKFMAALFDLPEKDYKELKGRILSFFDQTTLCEDGVPEEKKTHRELTNLINGALKEESGGRVVGFMDLVYQWRSLFWASDLFPTSSDAPKERAQEAFTCENCGADSSHLLALVGIPVRVPYVRSAAVGEDGDYTPLQDVIYLEIVDFDDRVRASLIDYTTDYAEVRCTNCLHAWILHHPLYFKESE